MNVRNRKLVLWGSVIALALGALVASGGPPAVGEDRRVARLQAKCRAPGSESDRMAALRDLERIDSPQAHAALEEMARGRNSQLAARACVSIARANYAGAKDRLKRLFEDKKVSHGGRVGAFISLGRMEVKDGTSWATLEAYGKEHAAPGSKLADSISVAKGAITREPTARTARKSAAPPAPAPTGVPIPGKPVPKKKGGK